MTSFNKTLNKALNAIGVIVFNERSIDLLRENRAQISTMTQEFADQKEMNFVGLPYQARNVRDFALDSPSPEMIRAGISVSWKITPTGLGTFDNVWPASALDVRWDPNPDHHALLTSIMEIGSANNMMRMNFPTINGLRNLGRFMVWQKSRLPSLKIYEINPAIKLIENSRIRLSAEFEGDAQTEIVGWGTQILPYEILVADSRASFVSAVAGPS